MGCGYVLPWLAEAIWPHCLPPAGGCQRENDQQAGGSWRALLRPFSIHCYISYRVVDLLNTSCLPFKSTFSVLQPASIHALACTCPRLFSHHCGSAYADSGKDRTMWQTSSKVTGFDTTAFSRPSSHCFRGAYLLISTSPDCPRHQESRIRPRQPNNRISPTTTLERAVGCQTPGTAS